MTARHGCDEPQPTTRATPFWSLTDLHRGATRPRVDVCLEPEGGK